MKKRAKKTILQEGGKYCLDVSKLAFGDVFPCWYHETEILSSINKKPFLTLG